MNKSLKVLAVGALATGIAVSATSCDNSFKKGTVNVSVNYVTSGKHYGVTWQDDTPGKDLDGQTLSKGTMLPMWKELQERTGVKILDVADYDATDLKTEWANYLQNDYKKGKKQVELTMGDGTESQKQGNQGKLYDIAKLVNEGRLPNFKKWTEANSAVYATMKNKEGKVFYTPYFDGLNSIEKMFLLDSAYTKKLLDDNSEFDGAAVDKIGEYTPQVVSMTNETIKVGANETIKVSFTAEQNVIVKQNALASKTGATLATALRTYIDDVYGDYIGEGKTYSKRSDIFLSEKACYNADELVALLRVAKANPQLLTGSAVSESNIGIVPFTSRTGEANRQRQVLELAAIFGVRGVSAEKDKLYFDKDGKIQDARTDEALYNAMDVIHNLYAEGLIQNEYYKGYKGGGYKEDFRKNYMQNGNAFCLYDYNATTVSNNRDAHSDDDKWAKANQMEAVLPPVVKWDAGSNSGQNNYFHFSEDSRQLKTGGWSIPANINEDNLDAICKVIDFFFSDEGADLQDFGPNTTTYRKEVTKYDANGKRQLADGKNWVEWSDKVLTNKDFKNNWNNFCRQYIGSTQGVGHVRNDGVDYQSTVSAQGRAGLSKLQNAVKNGALVIARSDVANGFFKAVPTSFPLTATQEENISKSNECKTMETFWKESNPKDAKSYTAQNYTLWIINGPTDEAVKKIITSKSDFFNTFNKVDTVYRDAYQQAFNSIK